MSKRRYQARVKIISRSNGVEMMDLEVGDFLEKFVGGLDEDNRKWYETVVYGATEDEDEEDEDLEPYAPGRAWEEFDEEADYGCKEDNYWFKRE